jgi:hypothetical protein
MVSQAWKDLSEPEREKWEEMGRKDKARYEMEKSMYNGPWKVPASKKMAKDPTRPKRPMSAFLSYSNSKRKEVKEKYKDAKTADISRILAQMWKDCPEEEKQQYVDEEFRLRQTYKISMSEWKTRTDEEETRRREARENEALKMVLEGKLPPDPYPVTSATTLPKGAEYNTKMAQETFASSQSIDELNDNSQQQHHHHEQNNPHHSTSPNNAVGYSSGYYTSYGSAPGSYYHSPQDLSIPMDPNTGGYGYHPYTNPYHYMPYPYPGKLVVLSFKERYSCTFFILTLFCLLLGIFLSLPQFWSFSLQPILHLPTLHRQQHRQVLCLLELPPPPAYLRLILNSTTRQAALHPLHIRIIINMILTISFGHLSIRIIVVILRNVESAEVWNKSTIFSKSAFVVICSIRLTVENVASFMFTGKANYFVDSVGVPTK